MVTRQFQQEVRERVGGGEQVKINVSAMSASHEATLLLKVREVGCCCLVGQSVLFSFRRPSIRMCRPFSFAASVADYGPRIEAYRDIE